METSSEFGGATGTAVLGSIGAAVHRHEIPASAPDAARETLGGAPAVAHRVPGLAEAAREAFTSGMRGAARRRRGPWSWPGRRCRRPSRCGWPPGRSGHAKTPDEPSTLDPSGV
ncbi:hypothetical protein [Streptomyces thermogriseus]|uniref:hypothetical protein n=1 Tax=Streptomyces thermogriseus TaxID=75292 RepID=UPI003D15D8DA